MYRDSVGFRRMAAALAALLLVNPPLLGAAQLEVDSTAGGNTTIGAAGNGVPLVNIATPNAKGLSHNKFTDYNVDRQGLILNNASEKLQATQLGGYINGNPNLNGRAAQVILNEVTGSKRSELKGTTEVAGSSAHVIVANPHGISCDGCGFINTPKATLTTGAALIKDGQLKSYEVDKGEILIGGAGMDVSHLDAFEVISRATRINGDLHAGRLTVVAGRNSVDAKTLQATAKTDDGSEKPHLAIDSSALGGMYAGAIKLIGTEDGVGVNISGDMAASSADIEIDANGKLTVIRTASGRDLRLNAQKISLVGDNYVAGEVKIKTDELKVEKALASGSHMLIDTQHLHNQGTLQAGIRPDGSHNKAAQLQVQAKALNNGGQILSHGQLAIQAQQLHNNGGYIKSASDIDLKADSLDNQGGQILAQGELNIKAQQIGNRQGQLLASGDLILSGNALDNAQGTVAAGAAIKVQLTEHLENNKGLLEAGSTAEIKAQSLNNSEGKLRALGSGSSSLFMIGGLLDNTQGQIEMASSDFALTAGQFMQDNQGKLLAAGNLQLAGNHWQNFGNIRSDGAMTLSLENALDNQGMLASGGNMHLAAPSLLNQQGLVYSAGTLTLATERLGNLQGDIYSLGSLSFIQDRQGHLPQLFSNRSGTVESAADIKIHAAQIDNLHAVDNLIESRKVAAWFYNQGCTDCSGDKENVTWQLREVDRTFAHSDLPGSALLAGGNLHLQGQQVNNSYSRMAAGADVSIKAQQFAANGAITGENVLERWVQSRRMRSTWGLIAQVRGFNARHWPLPADVDSKADISVELNQLLGNFPTIELRSTQSTPDGMQPYQALVQAGGTLHIDAQQTGNASLLPSFTYVSGGARDDGAIGTLISLSSELPDSLQRQRIDPLSGAQLPTSAQGLFVPSQGTRYRIETNPALASLHGYLNSDYLLRQLGYDADRMQRRLGDGGYEQHLIREAVMARYGTRWLGGAESDEAQFKALMDNGVAAAGRLQLTPGIALSAAQVAALTQDMVWLEEREVGKEKVLAPVLYLAQSAQRSASGSRMVGRDVLLSADNLHNGGALQASGELQVFTAESIENSGQISAGSALALLAGQNIENTGKIQGQSVQLWTAEGDIHNQRRIDSHQSAGNGTQRQQSFVQQAASISATQDLQLQAGRDIQSSGGTIRAGSDLLLHGGRGLKLQAARAENSERSAAGERFQLREDITHYASEVSAGGNLYAQSGEGLMITGSALSAGAGLGLDSGGDLSIRAAVDEQHQASRSHHAASSSDRLIQRESLLTAGDSLHIESARDLDISASQILAGQDLSLAAGQDIRILSAQNESAAYAFKQSRSTFSRKSREEQSYQSQNVAAQLAAGGNLSIYTAAGGADISVIGSRISAAGDLRLQSAQNLALLAASEESSHYRQTTRPSFGLSASSHGLSFASSKRAGDMAKTRYAVASELLAGGDTHLFAAQDVQISGSHARSGNSLYVQAGRDVYLTAAQNQQDSARWKSQKQSGISLSADRNGLSAFAGQQSLLKQSAESRQSAAASLLQGGQDVQVRAGRDIWQIGSDLLAGQDIDLQAARNIEAAAATETQQSTQSRLYRQNGLGLRIDHNFGNTKDALAAAGKGEDRQSRASTTLAAIDSVNQFTSGLSNSTHLGRREQGSQSRSELQSARGASQQAGRDIHLQSATDIRLIGSEQQAGRDLAISAQNIRIDAAQGHLHSQQQERTAQSGLNGAAAATSARGGIGGSYGTQNSESQQGLSWYSLLQAARNLDITVAQDLHLRGAQVSSAGDIRLSAGRDLDILAVQNESQQQSNRHSGGGEVGLAFGGKDFISLYASVDYGKGELKRLAARQINADLRAGGHLALASGQDTRIAGAWLEGETLSVGTGRNLHIASIADTGKVSGKELDISATVSIGLAGGGSASGSLGFGKTTGSTDWIDQQTALIARDRLDIHTQNHAQIDAALIASKTGNLKLDTETLGYSHHQGFEREHGWYLNAGGSYSWGGSGAQGSSAVTDKSQSNPKGNNQWNLSGYDYQKDRQQSVLATIGSGEIIVRSDRLSGQDSSAGINRDLSLAAQITKDYEKNSRLYVSSSSLNAISQPKETLQAWKNGLEQYAQNNLQAFRTLQTLRDLAKAAGHTENIQDNQALGEALKTMAWLSGLLVDIPNQIDDFTNGSGIFPASANYGGVFTQFIAQFLARPRKKEPMPSSR